VRPPFSPLRATKAAAPAGRAPAGPNLRRRAPFGKGSEAKSACVQGRSGVRHPSSQAVATLPVRAGNAATCSNWTLTDSTTGAAYGIWPAIIPADRKQARGERGHWRSNGCPQSSTPAGGAPPGDSLRAPGGAGAAEAGWARPLVGVSWAHRLPGAPGPTSARTRGLAPLARLTPPLPLSPQTRNPANPRSRTARRPMPP
jgi:hypothetical protein